MRVLAQNHTGHPGPGRGSRGPSTLCLLKAWSLQGAASLWSPQQPGEDTGIPTVSGSLEKS